MPDADVITETTARGLARECLYRFMSVALSDPYASRWSFVLEPENQQVAQEAATILREEFESQDIELGFGELPSRHLDLRSVLHELCQPIDELRGEYDRVFGLVMPKECAPYETEYHPTSEAFFRSQQLADIAGFYHAFGIVPSHSEPERPDHITLELEFMAFLLAKRRLAGTPGPDDLEAQEHARVCDEAVRSFFTDHLAWWLPAFAKGLGRKAGSGLYAALAGVLGALVPIERFRMAIPSRNKNVQPDLIERPEEQSDCASCPLRV